jgi:Holliday junction resolvasome RuvABC DNA-binding subunit
MTEGMKYEIIIENYHSVHDRVEENADSFVSLMWECEKVFHCFNNRLRKKLFQKFIFLLLINLLL